MKKTRVKKMTKEERIFSELGELKGITTATLEQAKKTNGRVTILEGRAEQTDIKFATDKGFRKGVSHYRVAIISVLTFLLGSIVVPIVAAYIQTFHK